MQSRVYENVGTARHSVWKRATPCHGSGGVSIPRKSCDRARMMSTSLPLLCAARKAAHHRGIRMGTKIKLLHILVWAAWASLARVVSGTKHHLYVGNLSPPASLHVLEFDNESLEFRVTNTTAADAPHAWITFNVSVELAAS